MTSPRGPRSGVPLVVIAAALSAVSGATDVTSFTRLGNVFASVMTGNLVLFGLAADRASATLAVHSAVAIAAFIFGVAVGSLVCRGTASPEVLWPRRVSAALLVELIVFAGFATGWELAGGRPGGAAQFGLLAAAALAMGVQSEATRHAGKTLATTYLTGTLTSTIASLVTRTGHERNRRLNLVILASVTGGAAVGGALVDFVPAALPCLPVAALVGVLAAAQTVGIRG